MVRIFFLCARRASLSHADYAAHLLERHVPLALRHHARLRGYAVSIVDTTLDGADPIDSVNVLSYESLADFEAQAYDSHEGRRLVTEDHARFLGAAAGYATRAQVRHDAQPAGELGAATAGTQWICALRRRAGLYPEHFSEALASAFAPDLPASQPRATRVAIARVERVLGPEGVPAWDAFCEINSADPARAPGHPFDSPGCAAGTRRAIAALCGATAVWRVREYVQRRAS